MSDPLDDLGAVRDRRPQIAPPGDLAETTAQAWEAVGGWSSQTDASRFLARYGTALVRLERLDDGHYGTMPLNRPRMLHVLARSAAWGSMTAKGDFVPCPPSREVADDMLVDPDPPLVRLERIVEVPVLAANGSVQTQPGYDADTRCFLAPANGLRVESVADNPPAADVTRARGFLEELVADFPFHGPAEGAHERSHALGLLLLPFVRALISGPTPLHLIEAPTPGTGKTLLADALTSPALGGRPLPAMTEARDGDEWRKRLTAKLRRAPEFVLLDNLRRLLDSSALASALTATVAEDRLLGVSETVLLPIRCAWIATANNPSLSDEMTRRSVRIRLDAEVEFPERRDGYTHSDLLGWAREQRGDLIWSALTLARAWIAAGSPAPGVPLLGRFEDWTRVVGGILEYAEIGTVLGNADALRAANRDSGPGAFLGAIFDRYGEAEFVASKVLDEAREHLPFPEALDDATLAHKLGNRLREFTDRPVGGYVLRLGDSGHGGRRRWSVRRLT